MLIASVAVAQCYIIAVAKRVSGGSRRKLPKWKSNQIRINVEPDLPVIPGAQIYFEKDALFSNINNVHPQCARQNEWAELTAWLTAH